MEGSKRSSKIKVVPQASHEHNSFSEAHDGKKGYMGSYYENYLSLGPRADGGLYYCTTIHVI